MFRKNYIILHEIILFGFISEDSPDLEKFFLHFYFLDEATFSYKCRPLFVPTDNIKGNEKIFLIPKGT